MYRCIQNIFKQSRPEQRCFKILLLKKVSLLLDPIPKLLIRKFLKQIRQKNRPHQIIVNILDQHIRFRHEKGRISRPIRFRAARYECDIGLSVLHQHQRVYKVGLRVDH
jgi:hypothetical protein